MEKKAKTISTLKKEQAEFEVELKNSYRKLGDKLFNEANDPTAEKNIIENEELINWQKLRDERNLCSENVLKIKNNEERLSELNKFQKEIEQSNKDNAKKITQIKPEFLFTVYKEFKYQCPSLLSSVSGDIKAIEDEIFSLNEEIEILEQEKKEAKFFAKIGLSSKTSSKNRKIKKLEKNIAIILAEKIPEIQNSEEIKSLYDNSAFSAETKKQYEELTQFNNYIDESKKRAGMINEEKEFVLKTLSELEADTKSGKRINQLNNKIKELDFSISEMLIAAGKKFTNQFYDEEGSPLSDSNLSDGTQAAYSEALNKISSHLKKLAKIKYNILYCEANQKIQNETGKIYNAQKSIKNAEKSIEDLKEKIKQLEVTKKNSEDELVSLRAEADRLKEKFCDDDSAAINDSIDNTSNHLDNETSGNSTDEEQD